MSRRLKAVKKYHDVILTREHVAAKKKIDLFKEEQSAELSNRNTDHQIIIDGLKKQQAGQLKNLKSEWEWKVVEEKCKKYKVDREESVKKMRNWYETQKMDTVERYQRIIDEWNSTYDRKLANKEQEHLTANGQLEEKHSQEVQEIRD